MKKLAILLFTFVAFAAMAAEPKPESRHEKDIAECRKAPPLVQHPADVKKAKAKQDAFNACMAGKGYAVGKIRAK